MKGILRKMRKEMKDEFLAMTDYQNQKRYREDDFYLSSLLNYRDSLMGSLNQTLENEGHETDSSEFK